MFCTKCGLSLPEDAVFCTKCGKAVNGPTPQMQTAEPQNQYPLQSSLPVAKKTKKKALVIIGILAAVVVAVIAAVVIITGTSNSAIPTWEGYASFEDFARAAEINDILSVGPLNEQSFYAMMGGAFVGSILEPLINAFIADMEYGTGVKVTAEIDFVNGSKLSEKYYVPPELRQNYNYLVKRTGIGGSKTYLALRFDGEKVFGVYIPYSGWIVMVYEEGALIKF